MSRNLPQRLAADRFVHATRPSPSGPHRGGGVPQLAATNDASLHASVAKAGAPADSVLTARTALTAGAGNSAAAATVIRCASMCR
jgi:hypothetical protein